MHGGTASTLAKVRSNYWIPKARQLVKKVIKNCFICRKYLAKPIDQYQPNSVNQTPAFSVCGLDFAGPLYVNNFGELQKSYIVLFTCRVTRALHLELVSDMTTNSFLLAFRRFFARRGGCKVIYSDNAKTFLKSKKETENLFSILSQNMVPNFIGKERIIWKNTIERSPWWGGFYERLVRSVKESLHKILGKVLLSFEEITTILTEIEAVLNLARRRHDEGNSFGYETLCNSSTAIGYSNSNGIPSNGQSIPRKQPFIVSNYGDNSEHMAREASLHPISEKYMWNDCGLYPASM
ncbi:integrase catalytic domain-containing protein [Trichonephila clavipes]|nr:integrase catalytic domain-containing protein [Trichonephila clavipes]